MITPIAERRGAGIATSQKGLGSGGGAEAARNSLLKGRERGRNNRQVPAVGQTIGRPRAKECGW